MLIMSYSIPMISSEVLPPPPGHPIHQLVSTGGFKSGRPRIQGQIILGVVAMALPVLAGKEEQAKQFGKGVEEKNKEWKNSEKRLRINQEAWFLQSSPMGSMIIVYIQAKDIGKMFTEFAQSKDPFDVWLKDQAKMITGVDLNNPPSGPVPELLFSYGY